MKARSYDYQSSPYTIDGITEEGRNRNTTDWRFFYDNADRLIEAHGGFLQDFSFDYDQADNLTRMATPDGTTIMHPDQTNAIRALIHRRGGLGEDRRLRPDYDRNGNLTDDGERRYTWDGLNHLTAIAYHGHPRWHTTLSYDGLDHLVTITERDGQNSTTQHLLWCGEAICAITDDQGQLITRIFQQGEWQQGKVLYYAKDHLGSIRDVLGTLPPAGELINLAAYDYGPYGERLDEGRGRGAGAAGLGEGASADDQDKRRGAIQTTLGYAGMFYHARSGLYFTHYRAYDPRLGRWLSRDPIWEQGGVNLYGYVGGDPVGWVDPWGLDQMICFYPSILGHIGFGTATPGKVTTYGFYPVGRIPKFVLAGPGQVIKDPSSNSQRKCITIKTSNPQDKCMEKCRDERQSDPGWYSLPTRQCTSFVRTCLERCDIPTGNDNYSPVPEDLYNSLDPNYSPPPILPWNPYAQ